MCSHGHANGSQQSFRYEDQSYQEFQRLTSKQSFKGKLKFATDAWKSRNHRAYVALVVFYEDEGKTTAALLDIVEVPESHTGRKMAEVFKDVLVEFGILDKVRQFY